MNAEIDMFGDVWAQLILSWACYCCCSEDIQIAPLLHNASTHSLNTWTRPPPTLTLGAMVPVSASCGGRRPWVVTLAVVERWSRWPLRHYVICVYCGTMVFVWHHWPLFLPNHGRYNGYCICCHKEMLFLWAPWSQRFTTIPQSPGDACDHWTKRAGPDLVRAELWGVGTSIWAFTYWMKSALRGLFYSSNTL